MKKLLQASASLGLGLLMLAVWPSANRAHNDSRRERLTTEFCSHQKTSPPQQGPARPVRMKAEEKLVRDVYARLMRYQTAARDEVAARNSESSRPGDYLTFELQNIHSGPIKEISGQSIRELVTARSGSVLTIKSTHLSTGQDPEHAYYEAEWTTVADVEESTERPGQDDKLVDVESYTSYEVTARLGGKERTYQALVLHRHHDGSLRSSSEILDNITSEMNTVLHDESPRVRSPWNKYVKSSLYVAVTSTIRETQLAGQPLIPIDAPIGYLPGDDASPNGQDALVLANEPCQTTTVSITVSGVANTDKATVGGLVVLKSDNLNPPRQQITVEQAQPASYTGNVTLTRSNAKVKLFTAATSGTEITFNGTDNRFANSTLPRSFYVEGAEFSSSMRDVTLQVASDGASPATDQATFTVLWVDQPTVVFSGNISADNAARQGYIDWTNAGWDHLDLQTYNDDRFGWGDEAAAVVHPSNFNYPSNDLRLERDYSFHDWIGNGSSTIDSANFSNTIPPGNDTGPPWAQDNNPQPNGIIYDFDAAGLHLVSAPQNQIRRTRNNFKAFASITINGTAVRCSPIRLYFIVSSMRQMTSPSGNNWAITNPADVANDNQAGYGTTRLTWNLQ